MENTQAKMWEHFCKEENCPIRTEEGHECNWCGKTEESK